MGKLSEDSYSNLEEIRDYVIDALIDISEGESEEWNQAEDLVEDITKILDEHGLKDKYISVKATYNEKEPKYIYLETTDSEGEQETLELDVKNFLELAEAIKKRREKKGRGWWGESERHAEAAKKGKKDLIHDLEFKGKEGVWRTTETGKHYFIEKGQSPKEAWDKWKHTTTKKEVLKAYKQAEKEGKGEKITKKLPWEERTPQQKAKWKKKTKEEIKALELQKEVAEKDPEKSGSKIIDRLIEQKKRKLEQRSGKKKNETPKKESKQVELPSKEESRKVELSTKAQDKEEKKQKYKEMIKKIEVLNKTATPEQRKELSGMIKTISKRVAALAHDLEYIGTLDFVPPSYYFIWETHDAYDPEAARAKKEAKRKNIKAGASKRTKVAKELKKKGITPETSVVQPQQTIKVGEEILGIPSIQTPSGLVQPGKIFEGTGDRPMTPVSSSIVHSKGVHNGQLLLKFHNSQGVYPYEFGSNTEANAAWKEISEGSPGRWVWNNLRGHKKGEKVTPDKIGKAIVSGKPTIGGKGSAGDQKHPYGLEARSPVPNVPNVDKIAKALREVKMGIKDEPTSGEPYTQGEIEKYQKTQPSSELVRQTNFESLKRSLKQLGLWRGDFEYIGSLKESYHVDTIDLAEFSQYKEDSLSEKGYSMFHGPITRAGRFPYKDKEGKKVYYYKDWENLKDVFSKYDYIPLKATYDQGAHHARYMGFATNFQPDEKHQRINADVVVLEEVEIGREFLNPEGGHEVSIGFGDYITEDKKQIITYLDHLAMSLTNKDMGRCRAENGDPCYVKQLHDHQLEVHL